MSILTAPSAFQAPFAWRTVKFGVCVPDQSTEFGSIGLSWALSTSMCMRVRYVGSLRICAEISVLAIEDGTVQVGLSTTPVISAVSVGEGFSVLPAMTRERRT